MATPELVTERLVLRFVAEEDIPALLRFHAANAEHLAPTALLRPPDFHTAGYWQGAIARAREEVAQERSAQFGLFLKDDPGVYVGQVNLNNIVRGAAHYCDLGIAIGAAWEGQGLMAEAVRAVIRYAFAELRLHRLRACYLPTNERSGRLLRRLGFVVEGYARDYLLIQGRWQDQILVGLVNETWQPPG